MLVMLYPVQQSFQVDVVTEQVFLLVFHLLVRGIPLFAVHAIHDTSWINMDEILKTGYSSTLDA